MTLLVPGTVFWITGLSGAGKSSIATQLCKRRREAGHSILLFDGDTLRSIIDSEAGYEPDERRKLAFKYAELCREVSLQGIDVACATISLFHEVHDWNRANLPDYIEIYIHVALDMLKSRDPKGLYQRATNNSEANVYGIDLVPEEPKNADLIIENDGVNNLEFAVDQVLSLIENRK